MAEARTVETRFDADGSSIRADSVEAQTCNDGIDPAETDAASLAAELSTRIESLLARFDTNALECFSGLKRQAEAMVEQAYGEQDRQRAIDQSRQALTIDPQCVSAYIHLADRAIQLGEAIPWLSKGVEAAEQRLRSLIGLTRARAIDFPCPEVNDFLLAKKRLGESLRLLGDHDSAVEHFEELLQFNPSDHLGIRYSLAASLLELERNAEAEALTRLYEKDASTHWAFNRALLAFRRQPESIQSRELLINAKNTNKYVIPYLLTVSELRQNPLAINTSDLEFDAYEYVRLASRAWSSTPDALAWISARSD